MKNNIHKNVANSTGSKKVRLKLAKKREKEIIQNSPPLHKKVRKKVTN